MPHRVLLCRSLHPAGMAVLQARSDLDIVTLQDPPVEQFHQHLSSADAVLVTEVYGAGEMPQPGVNGKLIVDAICETRGHPEVYYIPQQDAIPAVLQNVSRRGDLVLTLGAGDISKAGEDLLGILEERGSKP